MLAFVAFVVGVLVVGGLIFLGASLLLGRGETRPPAEPGRSPVELPADRAVTGEDVRGLQMSVTVRGYRMAEVDWLLDQLAAALDERDAELAALRLRERPHPGPAGAAKDEPGTADGGARATTADAGPDVGAPDDTTPDDPTHDDPTTDEEPPRA